jgi:molecular chaperone GrpE
MGGVAAHTSSRGEIRMTDQQIEGAGAENGLDGADTAAQEESVESLRQQLDEAQQEAAQNYDKFLRARADMENYRKRMERTSAERTDNARKAILTKLLAVKDNLQRALHYGESHGDNTEGIIEGVKLTEYQLNQILSQEGVQRIEAEGKPFDPADEEAVQTVHDPNTADHQVVQVVRDGYTYRDEVLRPAQVIVNVHRDAE